MIRLCFDQSTDPVRQCTVRCPFYQQRGSVKISDNLTTHYGTHYCLRYDCPLWVDTKE